MGQSLEFKRLEMAVAASGILQGVLMKIPGDREKI